MEAGREVLPINTNGDLVPPFKRTRLAVTRNDGPLMLERLFLSSAGTPGGAGDWIVHDVEIDGNSQLSMKDLSGALFSSKGLAAGKRATSHLLFSGLDVVETGSEVVVTVTYVGPNPKGVPFFASIVGGPPPQRPTVLPIATKKAVAPTTTTTIRATLDVPLKIERLEISDEGTEGGAADWIVNDLRVDGASQFTRSGDVPGDMFSASEIDGFVWFQPGKQIDIIVTYIGLKAEGVCFAANFLGTVVRDDHDQPPPDVHAIVRTAGQDLGEKVTARCNWRPPHAGSRRLFEHHQGQEKKLMSTEDRMKKMQEECEKAVADHLAACERIRKKLELPPEGTRAPMRLESSKKIKRTDPRTDNPTPVVARPQAAAMRVEEIEILSKPDEWMIADIRVGNRSQFPQAGPPMPGRLFTPGGTCYHFVTDTIQMAMDFEMLVHYVGEDPEGGVFEAAAMGTMARY